MWLRLDSERIIYGESRENLDKHLYWGSWQGTSDSSSSQMRRKSPSPEPEGK